MLAVFPVAANSSASSVLPAVAVAIRIFIVWVFNAVNLSAVKVNFPLQVSSKPSSVVWISVFERGVDFVVVNKIAFSLSIAVAEAEVCKSRI